MIGILIDNSSTTVIYGILKLHFPGCVFELFYSMYRDDFLFYCVISVDPERRLLVRFSKEGDVHGLGAYDPPPQSKLRGEAFGGVMRCSIAHLPVYGIHSAHLSSHLISGDCTLIG